MPSTSAQASNPQKDCVSLFLSLAEDREFRNSDSDSDQEEEGEQETQFNCVSEKPLKNTKRRKLEKFPLPVECDNSYPLKLDESNVALIVQIPRRKRTGY